MIAGKKTEGSVETCQRKEERKAERKARKVDHGGKQNSWVQRTLSEARAIEARVRGLILQSICRRLVASNHRHLTSPPRNDPRELPARSGTSIPHLRLLVCWMLPTRFRGKASSPTSNKRGMCCCSLKAYGVEESKHRCPLVHTTHQYHDPNNNCQNYKLVVKAKQLDKDQIKVITWESTVIRRLRGRVTYWGQRQRKRCKLNSFSLFRRRHHLTTTSSKTSANIKFSYKKLYYLETCNKEDWRHVHTADPGTVEGIGKPVLWASGAEGGQQKGDKAPDSHGRPWWAVNGSNSESGDDPGHCTRKYANDSRAIHDAATKKSPHNRSFDVYISRRKELYKSNEGLQRSASIDQSRSDDDNFFSFIKYRDKSPNRGAKTETISSSSEDPAADLKTVLRSRSNKFSDRKRSSTGRRTEAGHKRSGGESNRSRRRQAKKVERSPSSRSSSSSRSGSASRARASGGLTLSSTSRIKKNRTPKETNETFLPFEGNCKDDTKEFLRKLDSILTDLVENEKRKISSYGLPSVQNSTEGDVPLNRTSKKKSHKHKHRKANKEPDQAHIEKEKEEASPSLQQLRATLRTVRLRKRPTQPTADVLDTHSRCFTEKQPHNPRILRSQQGSQLLSHRCYQPPRRRQPRSHLQDKSYPSDFYSSDEDKTPLEGTCQDIPQKQLLDDTNGDDQQQHASSSHKENEDDICYGTDHHGSQGPPVRRSTTSPSHLTQRLMEAADSGDHSVDSAYTGSRGATPESILYPSVKPRRTGSSLNTPFTGARPRPSRLPRCSPKAERLQQLKRNILNDIREGGLYSDESINSLLEQYRRRYCHFPSTDLALIMRSIQDDLGVKPRPAEYLYQILIASEDDHSPSSAHNTTAATTTDTTSLTKVPSPVKRGTFHVQQKGGEQQTCSAPALTPILNINEGASFSGQEEADEAWAKSVLGEVAPELVQEAKKEARQRHQDDDGDAECSTYVADLCHQLQLNI
ncbi:uncharacterized protein LOC123505444 isoform X2 [Portunus trituberculatus]|nr:uncharacterized protein LOC123505444 isoform X2 [Portunus trituberculatus]